MTPCTCTGDAPCRHGNVYCGASQGVGVGVSGMGGRGVGQG